MAKAAEQDEKQAARTATDRASELGRDMTQGRTMMALAGILRWLLELATEQRKLQRRVAELERLTAA